MATMAAGSMATAGLAQQNGEEPPPPVSRTEASQIELPQVSDGTGPGRAYLDSTTRASPTPPVSAAIPQTTGEAASRAEGRAPASQISARGQGGPGVAQLTKAELDATLAQLTPAERRVLLQAIEGTDICNDPPDVAAIVALCRTRIETRSAEFRTAARPQLSAEDRLLQGDLENTALPNVNQVIERLARGGASSGDFSNQAIASIALGTNAPAAGRPRDEEAPGTADFGEEAQALINAIINQLGGSAP